MPSPFPGIDPYLESQAYWPDFHARFLIYCCDAIAARLPSSYITLVDERIRLVEPSTGEGCLTRPDRVVGRREPATPVLVTPANASTAVLDPVVIPLPEFEEVRETQIRILHVSDRSVVTVLELLSPSNKVNSGFHDYLDKRIKLQAQPIHLIELDFLLGGQRLPMRRPLPPGDYYALIARADRRPNCDVYSWSVRQHLPEIPVPLKAPDPDVFINLSELYSTAFERGFYARVLDYQTPLQVPLAPEDRAWAEELACAAAR
jgi:hypothetical protein